MQEGPLGFSLENSLEEIVVIFKKYDNDQRNANPEYKTIFSDFLTLSSNEGDTIADSDSSNTIGNIDTNTIIVDDDGEWRKERGERYSDKLSRVKFIRTFADYITLSSYFLKKLFVPI
ncbi:21401_t:CDS:2 [Entrophospora sp. SA101]|nr:21401_t:CDS:2 [Entrophospora sp. SA101]